MVQEGEQFTNNDEDQGGVEIKQMILQYLHYWPWFLLCIIIALAGAALYLRYTTTVYETSTQVKILDDSEDGGLDLSGLSGSSAMFNMNETNLANEMNIMRSRRLLKRVVDTMGLNTSYYKEGSIKRDLIFNDEVPFDVHWIKDNDSTAVYFLNFLENGKFEISTEESSPKTYAFADTINLEGHVFTVNIKPENISSLQDLKNSKFSFQWKTTPDAVTSLSKQITIEPLGEESDILNATITGSSKKRNEAILDNLVNQFNQDGIEDNRLVSERTAEFVKDRLIDLTKELDTVEGSMVDYKQKSDILNVEANSKQLFEKETKAEGERVSLENQLELAKAFKEELEKSGKYKILPPNIGIDNTSVNDLTQRFNEVVIDKQEVAVSATDENQMIKEYNATLDQLYDKVAESINSYIKSLEISLRQFRSVEQQSSGRLSSMPEKEKKIRAIRRQQKVKEELYLFLLQRREEALLSYAITAPTIKVVDYAYSSENPVKPKTKIILLASLILGFLLPFGVIYLKLLLDTKINDKSQLKNRLKKVSILSELPYIQKDGHKLIEQNDRTPLAEAFRILRTNLSFFKANKKESKGEVVYVTSSTKGEGKTFTAVNLANTWASTGKKTILVGADLRNPQLHRTLEISKDTHGLSAYLHDYDTDLDDLILKSPLHFDNLDVILSGQIPPNPAELLLNGRFEKMLEELKEDYDYVVVDTAPTLLVTDTLLISKWADVTVYMVRSEYTETKVLQHIDDLQKENKINGLGIAFNGIRKKLGYGYNYGYGYGYSADAEKSSPSWKFWKR